MRAQDHRENITVYSTALILYYVLSRQGKHYKPGEKHGKRKATGGKPLSNPLIEQHNEEVGGVHTAAAAANEGRTGTATLLEAPPKRTMKRWRLLRRNESTAALAAPQYN